MKKIRWDKKIILSVVGVALCVLLFEGIDFAYSQNQTDKNEVAKYYDVWTTIEKNGWPNYVENQSLFESLDISEDDYLLILDINEVNEEIVSLEQLQEILKITDEIKIDKKYMLEFTRSYPVKMVHLRVFYGLLIISFFFGISETVKKKEKMLSVYVGIYLLLGIAHLYGVSSNTGIVRGVLILGMTLLIGFFDELDVKSKEWKQYYVLIMLIIFMISLANAS